jgi:MFS family permease
MDFYRHLFGFGGKDKSITFFLVYLVSIIFTFQSLLTAYSSSTYLEEFILPEFVGLIFSAAALLSLIGYILLPRLLNRIGNVKTTILTMLVITLSLLTIGYAPSPSITILAFILFNAASPLVYFNIDIFLETLIGDDEGSTGSKRGLILTLMSAAAFLSPLAMGHLIGESGDLARVYYVAAAVGLIFLAIVLARFRQFYDPEYQVIKLKDFRTSLFNDKNINLVIFTQFLLQIFYTWAIIYFPLYLATEMGFTWDIIGNIIAVGLFAFVIFEYPAGIVADRHWGEKEMMALGFVLMALASAQIIYMEATIIGWMILMFISRIGASLVEVTTESYFFKQVKGHNSVLISVFRLTRPLSILAGSLIGSALLMILPFSALFICLAVFMTIGAIATLGIVDTK